MSLLIGSDYYASSLQLSNHRGLVAVLCLRSDTTPETARGDMPIGQASKGCLECAAQTALSAALRQEIAGLHAEVARLRAKVKMLQAQLSQTSANSHKPPSSDPSTRARVKVR